MLLGSKQPAAQKDEPSDRATPSCTLEPEVVHFKLGDTRVPYDLLIQDSVSQETGAHMSNLEMAKSSDSGSSFTVVDPTCCLKPQAGESLIWRCAARVPTKGSGDASVDQDTDDEISDLLGNPGGVPTEPQHPRAVWLSSDSAACAVEDH